MLYAVVFFFLNTVTKLKRAANISLFKWAIPVARKHTRREYLKEIHSIGFFFYLKFF